MRQKASNVAQALFLDFVTIDIILEELSVSREYFSIDHAFRTLQKFSFSNYLRRKTEP